MAVQPKYHWQFNEREGSVTKDINGVEAKLVGCSLQLHGRIGNAIQVNGKNGALYLGKEAGQFGTGDFTIAFGIVVLSRHDDNNLDIIGTRSSKSHGNWVSLLLLNKKRLSFEVDEDSNGTNYFTIQTEDILDDHSWHHVALVRESLTLRIYVDGVLRAEGEAPGIANIHNDSDMKVGDWLRDTPTARYEDLRIYDEAISALEIRSLIPSARPILRPGQIELIAVDQAAIVLSEDDTDLTRYSTEFQSLRLGSDTGATLYRGNNFEGASQKLYADVPEIRHTKIDAFPKSIQIWSSIGAPFTGKWIISAGNGQYLNQNKNRLEISPQHVSGGFFSFQYNPHTHQTLLIPANNVEMPLLKVGNNNASILVVDDSEFRRAAFCIANSSGNQWLRLDGTLDWTDVREERTLFYRVMKIADSEEQVGEITEGEVALYQHGSYHGKAWVLSDYEPGVTGNFMSLRTFQGLDNTISSIRVGPNTGVTLFANEQQRVDAGKQETQVEDIVDNIPDMGETQTKHDNASSLRIFRQIKPEAIFTSYVSKLSEDYRMVGDDLEQFSAYRTTLRFATNDIKVEVSATDLTTIEVEGETYEIDEVRTVTLQPNTLNRIMITSEADGLSTPGLKFRTQDMAENERVILFPHEEVHKQIAELEDDALWNAKVKKEDNDENTEPEYEFLIDHEKHSPGDIASVQNTIKRAMATVVNTPDAPINANGVSIPLTRSSFRSVSGFSRVVSTQQNVSVATIENPWTLNFQAPPITSTIPDGSAGLILMPDNIWEEPVEQNRFEQLFSEADVAVAPSTNVFDGNFAAFSAKSFFGSIGDAIKDAVSVTLGVADGAFNAIIDIGGKIVRFVLDTAKKVADFVEAVIEKVVSSIKKFIEFLRFLFNWDDILETKNFLVQMVNNALDSASDMVESAKAPVSDFFSDLQESYDDGLSKLIESLGGNPDEAQDDGFELPEAVEWFLTKILLGKGKSVAKDKKDDVLEELDQILNLPPIIQGFLAIFEQLQDFSEIGTRIRDEIVVELIENLISNPLRPQMLLVGLIEALRTVGREFLNKAEGVALDFLDLVMMAIDEFKDLLNTRLNIKFIATLFDLIGAGDPTFLNVTGMLVAIPATILSKLIFGEAPSTGISQPRFSALVTTSGLRDFSSQAEGEEESNNDENALQEARRRGAIVIAADLLNGLFTAVLDMTPETDEKPFFEPLERVKPAVPALEFISLVLSWISWSCSHPDKPEDGVPLTKTDQLFWERKIFAWRTSVLAFDSAYFLAGMASENIPPINKKIGGLFDAQRIKRANMYTMGMTYVFTAVDMGLVSKYLHEFEGEKRGREITNEVFGWLPNLCCALHGDEENVKSNKYLLLALGGIDIVSTAVTTGLSVRILKDDLKELSAGDEQS